MTNSISNPVEDSVELLKLSVDVVKYFLRVVFVVRKVVLRMVVVVVLGKAVVVDVVVVLISAILKDRNFLEKWKKF